MEPAILRLIDANCNRAREALRVLEDYARFVLDHAALCEALKGLRHEFQTATASLQARAIAGRDTSGDVGTAITTETEHRRDSTAAVVTAAGKRLGEALRTIEEYLKTEDSATGPAANAPSQARRIEQLRYRTYDLERMILLTLSKGRERMRTIALHVLVTESLCRRPWLETAELALQGGAGCLQLREKTMDGGELLKRARQIVALCRQYHAVSIINDRPDIALLSGADGVHVGQGDLPALAARQILGPDKIVGVSTREMNQAQQAIVDGADYVGCGPVFSSTTKPQDNLAGLAYAADAAQRLPIPAVAISGITVGNVRQLWDAGVRSIAVSGAVLGADDPKAAAGFLSRVLTEKGTPA
ncbi:MAG TPA: thiamine phosphate synthase [Tepidisphaeraceae bacterium]|jgi:thiamine-phosphate pyrophosphorylase